jgi:antitoxin (DNA-binding transcriptional repressor) of toxin-antitoxin stability system
MTTFTIHEAKTHLSRLINLVLAGETVVLARGKNPVAQIVPLQAAQPRKRELGWLRNDSRGKDPLAYGFWDPLPPEELALWNGDSLEGDPLNEKSTK